VVLLALLFPLVFILRTPSPLADLRSVPIKACQNLLARLIKVCRAFLAGLIKGCRVLLVILTKVYRLAAA
jgi:hypothetical protein